MQFDAFDSGNYPAAGKSRREDRLQLFCDQNPAASKHNLIFRQHLITNIAILKLFPGIHQQVVTSILHVPGLKAVVIETYGSGNAPTLDWLIDELKDSIEQRDYIVECFAMSRRPRAARAGMRPARDCSRSV